MGKVLKEIIIGLLLSIVVVFLLIVLLYGYAPNNTTVMEADAYKRTAQTSEVLQEIATASITTGTTESIIKSYTISSSDLKRYAGSKVYDQGRGNPFADVEKEEKVADTSVEGSQGTTGSSNGSTSSSGESTGYFNSTGKNK